MARSRKAKRIEHDTSPEMVAARRAEMRPKKPSPVAWCDEHNRYFFYKYGCTKDAQPVKAYPTPNEVRAYFDWAKTALSGRSK